jgi:hypothetical protein
MSRLLALALALGIFVSTGANAGLPANNWKEIMENPKYKKTPTMQEIRKKAVPATAEYQLFKVADRFGFLFDGDGMPVVAFDYSMDPLSWKQIILGSIGIGGWSLRGLWSKYRKIYETPEDVLKNESRMRPGLYFDPSDETDATYQQFYKDFENEEAKWLSPSSEDDVTRGKKEFAKIEFRDEWIAANSMNRVGDSKGKSGFKPATFALSDLYLKPSDEDKMFPTMAEFSKLILRQELKRADLIAFLAQFKMKWSEEAQEFTAVWDPEALTFMAKSPQLPGWVLNYINPYDILAYKYGLNNLERNSAILESILGRFGGYFSLFVSRIVNNLKGRQNYHENSMQQLLEGYLRGEYKIDIPWDDAQNFVQTSIVMLCLNKMIDTDDVTDGVEKCRVIAEKEEKARSQNLAWLEKKKYKVMVWSDNRHATVFKDDKKKGIVSLAISRHWLTKQPSWLHYESVQWYKQFNRIVLEVFTDAVRLVMPQNLNIGRWLSNWFNVSISVYLPSLVWDALFRGRAFTEIAYEGTIFMQVNEAMRGTWGKVPGFGADQLPDLKGTLAGQRVNPFEVPLKYETKAIAANYKLVIDWLSSGYTAPSYTSVAP